MKDPILYSFRRCPYAMRARLVLSLCLPVASVQLREVVLKNKPQALLDISAKATVPVLQLPNQIIDESLDIMLWALAQSECGAEFLNDANRADILALIEKNDGEFKWALDRYKYADRYEESQEFYRQKAEEFLQHLEQRLSAHRFLMGPRETLADLAIFPFVRQLAHVDKTWFFSSHYKKLQAWLQHWLDSALFASIMKKYPAWQPEQDEVCFP